MDVLSEVFLNSGGPNRLCMDLGRVEVLIVGVPLIGITEDLMRCVDRLGPLQRIHRTTVEVRVVLFGQQPVSVPDMLGGAAAVETQCRVVVWKRGLQCRCRGRRPVRRQACGRGPMDETLLLLTGIRSLGGDLGFLFLVSGGGLGLFLAGLLTVVLR